MKREAHYHNEKKRYRISHLNKFSTNKLPLDGVEGCPVKKRVEIGINRNYVININKSTP